MDPDVKVQLFKSISAKLCPTVSGQVRHIICKLGIGGKCLCCIWIIVGN